MRDAHCHPGDTLLLRGPGGRELLRLEHLGFYGSYRTAGVFLRWPRWLDLRVRVPSGPGVRRLRNGRFLFDRDVTLILSSRGQPLAKIRHQYNHCQRVLYRVLPFEGVSWEVTEADAGPERRRTA